MAKKSTKSRLVETVNYLSRGSFWESGHLFICAVDPFTHFSEHVDALEPLQNVALARALIAFSVAVVSCHSVNQFLE